MKRTYRPLRMHRYHALPDASLRYIIMDAGLALKAMASIDTNHPSLAKYADQVNDAATILHWRKTSHRWPKV